MASSGVDDLTEKLSKTSVDSSSLLSFKGKGLKLNESKDAEDIVKEIEKCSHMKALEMEGNTMGVQAAEVIAKAIGKHPEFERALWSDMFTGRLKTEIPHALRHLSNAMMQANCHLVELDLSDNAFGPNGIIGLVDLLKSDSCHSLTELKLNNNGLGITGGKMLAECLTECYSSSVKAGHPLSLRVFISGRNRLENEGSKALAAAFKDIGTLEHVSMPQNGINHPGISALAEAFSSNLHLKHLNLNDNTFTSRGAEAIAKAVEKLQDLQVINFGDCLVRTQGAIAIARALRHGHEQLKELVLSGNEIKTEGAVCIIESLEGKESLEMLDLDANMFGEQGCEELKDVLEAAGLQDVLGSLSGDEGSEDEDEEDGDEEEDEEPEEDEDGEIVSDPHLQVKGSAITPQKQKLKASDFLAFPSPSKLIQLGSSGGDVFLQELGDEKNDIEKVVSMLFKITLVVNANDETKKSACDIADQMLMSLFRSIDNADILVSNAFLVHMGLIKGENKKLARPASINGTLIVLEHIVRQSYFSCTGREIMKCFLSKPHPLLEKSSDALHKVLQTLYSF